MKKTLAIDTETNQYCFYDKDGVVDIQDTKFTYVRYIKDGSGLLIKYERLRDINPDNCDAKDVFGGSTPYFSFIENISDGFDYKGAYFQQVDVNNDLRSKINYLENIVSDNKVLQDRIAELEESVANGKMLINEYASELDKHEGDPVELTGDVDPYSIENDIRLKLLREKNLKMEEEINKLKSQNKSLIEQLNNKQNYEFDEIADVIEDHEDRITRLEKILNETSKKGCGSDDNYMIGHKKYDHMPYPNYVITETNSILV